VNNPIDKILTEWAYRVYNGMPDPSDSYHTFQLEQYLNELRLPRKVVKKVLEKVRKYKDNKMNQDLGRVGKPWGSDAKDVSKRGASDDDIDQFTDDELGSIQKSNRTEKDILSGLDKNQQSARKHTTKALDIEQIKSNDPNLSEEEIQHLEECKKLFDEFLDNDTPIERKKEIALQLKNDYGLTTNKPTVNSETGEEQPVKLYIKKNHDGGKVPRTIEKGLTTGGGGPSPPQTRLVNELNKYLDDDNKIQQNTIGGKDERSVAQTFETAAKPNFANEDGSPTGRKANRRNPKANFRKKDPNNPGFDKDGNPLYIKDPVVMSIFGKDTPLGDLKESYHQIEGPADENGNLISANTPEGQQAHMKFLIERNEANQKVKDECDAIINNPDVSDSEKAKFIKIKKAVEDYETEMKALLDSGKIPSKGAAKYVEKLNAKLVNDIFNAHPDIAGGIAKQFAENALVSEELAAGDEVYMPTSGVFPGGDKIHVTRKGQQIVGVAGISVKFGRASKETQIYGFPGEAQSMAKFAEPPRREDESDDDYNNRKNELRTRNGSHVGQDGHSIGVRDDIISDPKKQEQVIEQAGMSNAITDKKEFHTVTNDVKNEVDRFMNEQRKKTPPPTETAIKIQLQKHMKKWMKDNKIQERLENCVDREELTEVLTGSRDGKYIDKNGRERRHSNTLIAQNSDPIELINIISFVSTVREGKGMPSLAWNHQSYEDGQYHNETVNPNETDMSDPANWGFSSRMWVTSSRQGGGILSTGTGEADLKGKALKNT